MGYLNNDGLLYLWSKITSKFATKTEVQADIKSLQDSMGELGGGDMLKSMYDKNNSGIVDNAEKVNGFTVGVNVPADAVFTDTTYSNATTSKDGLQSAADKTKLDALPTNATLESTYAKKTDLSNLYRYKGSVTSEDKLPTSNVTVGDVYDILNTSSYGGYGMNVAWTGERWDALGEVFIIESITNSELDTICV